MDLDNALRISTAPCARQISAQRSAIRVKPASKPSTSMMSSAPSFGGKPNLTAASTA